MTKSGKFYSILILLCLWPAVNLSAQGIPFDPVKEVLDVGNIRATLWSDGYMFTDTTGGFAHAFEAPKGSGRHAFGKAGLYLGGYDPAGQLRLAASGYNFFRDFWPGPLTNGSAQTDSATVAAFNKIWRLTRTELDAFLADWADGTLNAPPSFYPAIFDWPDHEGTFINVNGMPGYQPAAGDYPIMKGDEMLFVIVNDKGGPHYSGGDPIGIEVHIRMYGYSCTDETYLANSIFLDFTLIQRSNFQLNNFFAGFWLDNDLGHPMDDYAGVDTTLGMFYTYNGDADDEGSIGYGLNPPAAGVTQLRGPLADLSDGIDNDKDGIIDEAGEEVTLTNFMVYQNNFNANGAPTQTPHFYGYLQSIMTDGTQLVDNYSNGGPGTGLSADGTGVPSNYMFPGDPCSGTGWTPLNANIPPFSDIKMIGASGPIVVDPGEINTLTYAVTYHREYYNDNLGSVCGLKTASQHIRHFYETDTTGLGYSCLLSNNRVYPGDTDHDQIANMFDLLPIGIKYGELGPPRAFTSTAWMGFVAQDWNDTLASGLDIKHVDCNGDGSIDSLDISAILQNYNATHNSLRITNSGTPLNFQLPLSNANPGDTLIIPITLGDSIQLAKKVYGMAFSVQYDTSLVEEGSITIRFDSSWVGMPQTELITLYKDFYDLGQVDIAFSRINKVPRNGYGEIARMIVVLDDEVFKQPISEALRLSFANTRAIDNKEIEFPISTTPATINIATDIEETLLGDQLKIYPNPATDHLNIQFNQRFEGKVSIMDLQGRIMYQQAISNQPKLQINLTGKPAGMYLVTIQNHQGATYTQKLILTK